MYVLVKKSERTMYLLSDKKVVKKYKPKSSDFFLIRKKTGLYG